MDYHYFEILQSINNDEMLLETDIVPSLYLDVSFFTYKVLNDLFDCRHKQDEQEGEHGGEFASGRHTWNLLWSRCKKQDGYG